MSCDVTLPSKPMQMDAKACYVSQFRSIRKRGRFLRLCNLRSLLPILSIIACGTVTAEVAGSSPVVPAIFLSRLESASGALSPQIQAR